MEDGVLSAKTKEDGAAWRCSAMRPLRPYHVQPLVELGALRQQLDETVGVVVYLGVDHP